MKQVNTKAIRIDGSTQSRASINNDIVSEYATQIKEGAEFPPVVVFNDGTDLWLADGFHRFRAHNKAGKTSIAADVRNGTVRDAILFSLGANSDHGIQRTAADKRKAVTTMLQDPEWGDWSDNAIAKACRVSHPFVGVIRRSLDSDNSSLTCNVTSEESKSSLDSESSEKSRKYKTKHGTTATMKTSGIGSTKPASPPVPPVQPPKEYPVSELEDDDAPDDAELQANALAAKEEEAYLHKLLEADDKLAFLHTENKKLIAEVAQLKVNRDGYMNTANEAIAKVKSLQRQVDKLTKGQRHG